MLQAPFRYAATPPMPASGPCCRRRLWKKWKKTASHHRATWLPPGASPNRPFREAAADCEQRVSPGDSILGKCSCCGAFIVAGDCRAFASTQVSWTRQSKRQVTKLFPFATLHTARHGVAPPLPFRLRAFGVVRLHSLASQNQAKRRGITKKFGTWLSSYTADTAP